MPPMVGPYVLSTNSMPPVLWGGGSRAVAHAGCTRPTCDGGLGRATPRASSPPCYHSDHIEWICRYRRRPPTRPPGPIDWLSSTTRSNAIGLPLDPSSVLRCVCPGSSTSSRYAALAAACILRDAVREYTATARKRHQILVKFWSNYCQILGSPLTPVRQGCQWGAVVDALALWALPA